MRIQAVLLIALNVVFVISLARADYRTYVIDPPINNDPILADEALPVQCRDETVMKVMCARGEYEPASFLVQTDEPLKQVMPNRRSDCSACWRATTMASTPSLKPTP